MLFVARLSLFACVATCASFVSVRKEAENGSTNADAAFNMTFDTRGLALHVFQGDVNIRFWLGRAGNNIKQLINAVVLAEATGRERVCLPDMRHSAPLAELFDFPSSCLNIDVNHEAQGRLKCQDRYYSSSSIDEILFSPVCLTNLDPEDFRRPMLKYLKPLFKQQIKSTCRAAGPGFDGLTVHLRSGDLLSDTTNGLQSRFAPCAFHLAVIKDPRFGFKSVKIITESDMAHPCIAKIKEGAPPGVKVQVQSGSMAQDICTLMTAQHVLHGSVSTFSMHFGWVLNENIKNTFWLFPTVVPGFKDAPCHVDPLALSTKCRRTFLYDIKDINVGRGGFNQRMSYIKDTPEQSVKFHHTECTAVGPRGIPIEDKC